MNILEILVQLRDDLKTWVTNNLNALNNKIDEKTIPIDNKLSATSTNPVQNKVINAEISSLSNLVGNTSVASQISTAIANQDLFSGDYNDLVNAPNISEDNSDNVVIADNDGNIIFKVDADGVHTTTLNAKNITIENEDIIDVIDDKLAALVNSAPETLDTLGELAEAMTTNSDAIEALETIATSKASQSDLDTTNENVSELQGLVGDTSVATQIANAIEGFESFSGDYNDLENAPNIAEDGAGNMVVADENGNVIFKADATGIHSTALTLNGEDVSNKINNLRALVGDKSVADQISDAVDGFESFSGDYNDLTNAPNINNNDDKELFVADNAGNVIFRINESGTHVTNLSIKGSDVEGLIDSKIEAEFNDSAEIWVFTLEDGSSVNKTVVAR